MENLEEKKVVVEEKREGQASSPTYTNIVIAVCIGALILISSAVYYRMDKKELFSPAILPDIEEIDIEENENVPAPTIPTAPDSVDVEFDYPEHSSVYEYPNFVEDTRDYSVFYKKVVPQEGVTWLPHPEKFEPARSPFVCGGASPECAHYGTGWWEDPRANKRNFYKIGTYYGKNILYTQSYLADPDGTYHAFFLSNADGTQYEFLTNHSEPVEANEYSLLELDKTIVTESDLVLNARMLPEYITIDGTRFALGNGQVFFGESGLGGMDLMEDTQYGPAFKTVGADMSVLARNGKPQTGYVYFGIRLEGGLMAQLWRIIPFMALDGVPNITFIDGTKNTVRYRGQLGGCGSGSVPRVALEPILDSELAYVGKTSDGIAVYNLVDINHPLITNVFEMTGGTYYTYDEYPGGYTTVEHTYTREDFVKAYGVLVYTDNLGYQNILTNEKFGPQAECGKPVIYLYPEEETEITVAVDATITKSEPRYEDGWTVTASPDGTLSHSSGTYTSLFWDGYGHGKYPEITGGLVVPSSDALTTMESQLSKMGFTSQEIADFSEFWKEHIPSKPFTRITWFLTNEMEELAQLTIDPKPDTLIRVFVDFEGLDAPASMKPQRLPRFERNGYTVVEWGGLLRKHVAE